MYELIQHQEVGSGGQTIVTFSSIPQIYTDLYLVASPRNTQAFDTAVYLRPNGSTANLSNKRLYGTGTVTGSVSTPGMVGGAASAAYTANTFSSFSVHLPNYTSSSAKTFSATHVNENNGTEATQNLLANLWDNSDPITFIELQLGSGGFAEFSTFTLFGVGRKAGIGRQPLASGGYTSFVDGYWVHTFTANGSFKPFVDLDVEYLVIAGGGAGGYDRGSGGGAGGYRSSIAGEMSGGGASAESALSVTGGTNYSVVIGAGGAAQTSYSPSNSGSDSTFSTVTSLGGGGGGFGSTNTGTAGGSGSGGPSQGGGPHPAGAGTAGQGFAGGNSGAGTGGSGGGGGAGEPGKPGQNNTGQAGDGGNGVASNVTGSLVYRAGGGGGGAAMDFSTPRGGGAGGLGGGAAGGNTNSEDGDAAEVNTGGGGGGGANQSQGDGGAGGSGIVIVRYRA